MSPEAKTRLTSTVVMTVLSAVVIAIQAVVTDAAFPVFLSESGLSNSVVALIVVAAYQVVAFLMNKVAAVPSPTAAGLTTPTSWIGKI